MAFLDSELANSTEVYITDKGKKNIKFTGSLLKLLQRYKISFTYRKTDTEGVYIYKFQNKNGMIFTVAGKVNDFIRFAQLFVQMELVRIGTPMQLYVKGSTVEIVSVNL
jgi:hypothetical protein